MGINDAELGSRLPLRRNCEVSMPGQVKVEREPAASREKQDGEISPELVLVSILPQCTGPDTTPESSSLFSHWEDTS